MTLRISNRMLSLSDASRVAYSGASDRHVVIMVHTYNALSSIDDDDDDDDDEKEDDGGF